MWSRLLLLLVVACLSGTVVGFVSAARPDKEAALRVATPPRIAKRSPACPIPKSYRAAFVRASDASGLPLAMLVAVAEVESRFEATAVPELRGMAESVAFAVLHARLLSSQAS